MKAKVVRILDSYASLLVLLLANFFLLELVDDPRWGAIGSTLLAAAALVVAISDPEAGHHVHKSHWILIGVCVALAPLVLVVNSTRIVGLTYLLPVALLVTATLPITLNRIIHHRQVTSETVLGALCVYVLIGLLFVFLYGVLAKLGSGDFFAQGTDGTRSLRLYFSFVTLATLGYGDYTAANELGRTLAVVEALFGQLYLVTVIAVLVSRMRGRGSA